MQRLSNMAGQAEHAPDGEAEGAIEVSFTWIPIYKELGERLLEYQDRQDALLRFLQDLADEGLKVIGLVDSPAEGQTEPLSEIDPFTFFANFNRGVRKSTRTTILERCKDLFELESDVPADFYGIPTVNNQSSWFFGYRRSRARDDVANLWRLTRQAVQQGSEGVDSALFDTCLGQHTVGLAKLTMGLYWLAPDTFLPLDRNTRQLLEKNGLTIDVKDWVGYRALLERARESWPSFHHLSRRAWTDKTSIVANEDTPVWKISPEVGARLWTTWKEQGIASIGWDELGDLTEVDQDRFERLRDEPTDTQGPKRAGLNQAWKFRNIPVGARIVANQGTTKVLGIGTVIGGYYYDEKAPEHKHRLLVRWDDTNERTVERPGWRRTLIRLKPSDLEGILCGPSLPKYVDPSIGPDFSAILAQVDNDGLQFSQEVVSSYLLALQTKRFVILSGISGTGKTQLALSIARAFQKETDVAPRAPATTQAEPTYEILPVRPDWTDARGLLGFHNPLLNAYVLTPALRLLLRARDELRRAKREERLPEPYFLVLDEMNLARVEHYFSDFLSAMESQESIFLHDDPQLEEKNGNDDPVPRRLSIPANLYVTGTVNVDETTYMFSPKVLDRAFTLEFDEVDLPGFRPLGDQEERNEATSPLSLESFSGELQGAVKPGARDWEALREIEGGELCRTIEELNAFLARDHRHFGYRVASEMARFLHLAHQQAGRDTVTSWSALDLAILSKVLVKLHGTQQELERVLQGLRYFCVHGRPPESTPDPATGTVIETPRQDPRLPRSAAKVDRMLDRLRQRGFASFIE